MEGSLSVRVHVLLRAHCSRHELAISAADSARRKATSLAAVCGMRLGLLLWLGEQLGGDGATISTRVDTRWELHLDASAQ